MIDLFKKNKKAFLIGGVVVIGGLAWYIFRTKKIAFYDNVWCADDDCSNVNPESYTRTNEVRESDGTGNLNLLFKEPHGLKVGEEIYITQNDGAEFPSYDGKTSVRKIYSPYVLSTTKARMGDSPVIGGFVSTSSRASKLF